MSTPSPTSPRLREIQQRIAARLSQGTLSEWWSERVDADPDAVALRTDVRDLAYGAFDALAERVATRARAEGWQAGDVVGIQLPASGAFLALILGLAKVGVHFSLLGTGLRGHSLGHALREVPVRAVFTTPAGRESIEALDAADRPAGLAFCALNVPGERGAEPGDSGLGALEAWLDAPARPLAGAAAHTGAPARARPARPPSPDDTLFYIFTSGTTGLPKATQCSHRRYLAGASSESVLLDMARGGCMYVVLPMFHIAALSAIGAALSVGASVVIRPVFSARRFWPDVQRFSVTNFQYLGEILRYVLARPRSEDPPQHTLESMMGAGITTAVWEQFEERFGDVRIVESYGSSEGVIGMFNLDGVKGSVGRPAPPLAERLRIVAIDSESGEPLRDTEGWLRPCASGEPGELIARLDDRSQFEGYTSEAATRSKFLENAFAAGDLWYRSGDAFREENGFYFFVSRLGDTFRWKGENVSAQEVADVLLRCKGVEHAVVYGIEVPGHEGSAGMALLSLGEGAAFDGASLRAELARELPPHALPLFLRIGDGQSALTETYKTGTATLKQQGYDPAVIDDALYLLDPAQEAFVPLGVESLARVGLPPFRSSHGSRDPEGESA